MSETENDPGYQSLQIQRNDYERLRHSRQTGHGSGSTHPQSQNDEYVRVVEQLTSIIRPSARVIRPTVSMATENESGYTLPHNQQEGYVEVTDYNSV